MKTKLLIGAGIMLTAVVTYAAKDPVVMTVNGKDVPKSEFEYLYHKNQQQQLDPQPIDEYVEMFKLYKLKVADALANGIDTTKKFRREMDQYRNELAAPYMADSTFIRSLAREAYDRAQQEVEAKHIMLLKGRTREDNLKKKALIDSIYGCLKAGEDFETLAKKYSEDRGSSQRGGSMGFITAGKLPYSFETVQYSTPEGVVSEVFESPVAFHIIKGGARRPAQGSFLASHILFLFPKNADEATIAALKTRADSVAAVAKADPSKFAELARKYSDDKGSAAKGGELPLFDAGKMVPEFYDAVVAMQDGDISDPVKSQFGWHVIYRRDHKPLASYQELEPTYISRITNPQDERRSKLNANDMARFGKKFKLKMNKAAIDRINSYIDANGIDDKFLQTFSTPDMENLPLFTIGKTPYSVASLFAKLKGIDKMPDIDQKKAVDRIINNYATRELREMQTAALENEYPDYRNLLNEYRDGSLMYEISLQKVWDKAMQDTEGLNRYFLEHRNDFKWQVPHVKGFLVKTVNDSVADLVRARLPQVGRDSLVQTIRKEFGKNVQIDKVLVKKGDNQFIDYLMFSPQNSEAPLSANYPVYFMFEPMTLTEPQEVDDVRGLVTGAYQDKLESDWKQWLQLQYPVEVNQKVLKKIK